LWQIFAIVSSRRIPKYLIFERERERERERGKEEARNKFGKIDAVYFSKKC